MQSAWLPYQVRQVRDWCSHNGFSVGQEYFVKGASASDDKVLPVQDRADVQPVELPRDLLEFALCGRLSNKA